MAPLDRSSHARASLRFAVLGLVALLAASGCDAAPAPTPSPTMAATSSPASTALAVGSPAAPSLTPPPSSRPAQLAPGVLAVTVTDDLRIRSAPGVGDDSIRHTPLLPIGTELVVTGGPILADDYPWYRVAPTSFTLDDGITEGWVAVADDDETPWVAPAKDPTPGFELTTSNAPPLEPTTDLARRGAARSNAFGIALYRKLAADPSLADSGIVVSPSSISMALAMARAGARGDTAEQIDAVLRAEDWGPLASGLTSLDRVLATRDATFEVRADDGSTDPHYLALRTANMAFAQDGFPLQPTFLDRLARTFRSPVGLVDYESDAPAAREAINGWVGRQTLGRIPALLTPPDVTADTRLMLVNATYFKGEWLVPFDAEQTRDRAFTLPSGAGITVPTMLLRGGQEVPVAAGDGWRATELRYLGPDGTSPLAMTLVDPDDMDAFERSLSPAQLKAVTSELDHQLRRIRTVTPPVEDGCGSYPYEAVVTLPRFAIETRASLEPVLRQLGMSNAFDPQRADFRGISTLVPLHIGKVIHQANIDVDERGTEAAAATAVGVDTGGCTGPLPLRERTIRLNKPFLYFVRDIETGAILFMGRVTDPTRR
jgi:serpin B